MNLPKNSQNPSKIVKNPSNFAENRNFWAISRCVKTPKLALLSNDDFLVFGPLSYSGYIPMVSWVSGVPWDWVIMGFYGL